jgi:hypothetical protein
VATRSLRRERREPAHSVTSGVMSASSKMNCTMRWCWPVEITIGS